jgi:hypothetical protein
MITVSVTTKNYILNKLGDSTDGLIRITIYDDNGITIGSSQTIGWNAASGGEMTMSDSEITFNVPASTVVNGVVLHFYSGTLVTGITYALEQPQTFNNAGTFRITDIILSVDTQV